jgi:hypothetical protein
MQAIIGEEKANLILRERKSRWPTKRRSCGTKEILLVLLAEVVFRVRPVRPWPRPISDGSLKITGRKMKFL